MDKKLMNTPNFDKQHYPLMLNLMNQLIKITKVPKVVKPLSLIKTN